MEKRNTVAIVFTFDNNFFIPALVTFHSLLKHANENTFYDIFIMLNLDSFSEENRNDLQQFEKRFSHQCKLTFIDMKNFGEEFAIQDARFNFSVYYRLFIHQYVDYDKVIFSDVDIVILKDLYEVYSTDISNNHLGAIKLTKVNCMTDRKFKRYINKASAIKKGNYVNAGFLLMNLKKIREGNYTDEFIKLAKTGFNNNDQDILNLVFENTIQSIPMKYCYFPIASYFKDIDRRKILALHSKSEIEEYENDPAIIHYAGTKPWLINTLKISELDWEKYQWWWNEFAECLPFVNTRAVFALYQKQNSSTIKLGLEYQKNETIPKAVKRVVRLMATKTGVYRLLKAYDLVD